MEDADELKEHVGRRMAELREMKALTQARVAEAIGTTVSNLQRIEYGFQNLTIETMTKVANAIGVKVAAFFAELERPAKTLQRNKPAKRRSR